jgi:hypothetical protein
MRKILVQVGLSVFFLSSSVWAADISGNWGLTMTGPQGEEKWDLVIKVEGTDLTITGKHPFLGDLKGSGKLDGDNITMKIVSTGQMVVNFDFKGNVKGNKMSGTREIEMGGGGPPGGDAPPGGGERPDFNSIPNTWSAEKK